MSKKMSVDELRRFRKNEGDRRRRANKKFAEAGKAGKRVIVAKDVLRQLAAGKIKAKHRVYLANKEISKLINSYDGYEENATGETQLCDLFSGMESCNACALGSVFVSAVSIKDKLKIKDVASGSHDLAIVDDLKMREYLGGIFSEKQLFMIENAFEGDEINFIGVPGSEHTNMWGEETSFRDDELHDKLIAFNAGVRRHPRLALERIMQNIVDNNGTFKP